MCVRSVAGWDVTRYREVFTRWPIRELLLAYRDHERRGAEERFKFRSLRWAILKAGGFKVEQPEETKI